jgi:hypothetical protein
MGKINSADIILSKAICDCVKKGMTFDEAMVAICKRLKNIEHEIDLTGVLLKELGIKNNCKLTYKNLLTEIINALIKKDIDFSTQLSVLQTLVNQINTTLGAYSDTKVSASATDTASGFLNSKITTGQVGAIEYLSDKIVFMGFVPVGSVFMISKNRLVDFDLSGKGRAGSDVWGYAIANGSNGTTNRLGAFPRYTSNLALAGNREGADTVLVTESMIPSLNINVTGTINDDLITPVSVEMEFNTNKINDGSGGSDNLLRYTPPGTPGSSVMRSRTIDLKHAHSHSLTARRVNNSPVPLSVVPSHILEIPIERINP